MKHSRNVQFSLKNQLLAQIFNILFRKVGISSKILKVFKNRIIFHDHISLSVLVILKNLHYLTSKSVVDFCMFLNISFSNLLKKWKKRSVVEKEQVWSHWKVCWHNNSFYTQKEISQATLQTSFQFELWEKMNFSFEQTQTTIAWLLSFQWSSIQKKRPSRVLNSFAGRD